MPIDKDAVLAALRRRYDYYSTQTMFDLARDRAGLADKPAFDAAELRAFRAALVLVGDRIDAVLAQLDELAGTAPAAVPAATTPPVVVAAPVAQPAIAAAPIAQAAEAAPPVEPTAVTAPAAVTAPPATATASPAAETTIVLTGLELGEDEQVMMCGELPVFGDWDPERARPMARKGDQWLATIELAPKVELSFKFLRRDAAGTVTWETGDNRKVIGAERLDASWR